MSDNKASRWYVGWVFASFIGALLAILTFIFLNSQHSFREMDWDNDTGVSLSEILYSLDVGKRLVIQDGKPCIQYFHLKDASEIRTDCAS